MTHIARLRMHLSNISFFATNSDPLNSWKSCRHSVCTKTPICNYDRRSRNSETRARRMERHPASWYAPRGQRRKYIRVVQPTTIIIQVSLLDIFPIAILKQNLTGPRSQSLTDIDSSQWFFEKSKSSRRSRQASCYCRRKPNQQDCGGYAFTADHPIWPNASVSRSFPGSENFTNTYILFFIL